MTDDKKTRSPIDPHRLVTALQPDPSRPPPRTVSFVGYPGKSSTPGVMRLWLGSGDSLTDFVEIPSDAIQYSQALPEDRGTQIWVLSSQELTYGSIVSATSAARFLSGAW